MLEIAGYRLSADGVTFLVALLCALIRFLQNCWHKSKTVSKDLVFSVLNGASIFPFCLMAGGVFSQSWLELAVSSKISMAIAGLVGLLFVTGEVLSPDSLKAATAAAVRAGRPAANDDNADLLAIVDVMSKGLTDSEKAAVKGAKGTKRIPREIDGKLLAACRRYLDRDLKHTERAAVRKRLLDIA